MSSEYNNFSSKDCHPIAAITIYFLFFDHEECNNDWSNLHPPISLMLLPHKDKTPVIEGPGQLMLLAILSDIHGNLEAFQAVIGDLEKREPSMVLCLGDLIGYGPDPDEVVTLFRHNKYISVLGNHEAALKDPKMRNWLNFQAKENSIQTERLLSEDNLQYCRSLAENLVVENGLFVHGFPPDSVLQYLTMIGDEAVASFFSQSDLEICFVGHTHDLLVVSWDGKKVMHDKFVNRKYHMQEENRYIINAGSVGQPRDGNNNAKYLLWNITEKSIEVVYVPYDFKATSKKIEKRGFPKTYGYRLW